MTLVFVFVGVLIYWGTPVVTAAALLYAYRRREASAPVRWDSGRGPGWGVTMLLSLLAGVAWMVVWYSWGGGPGHNQYPHWQVACSAVCIAASTAGLGWWARWRLSGPLAAVLGSVAGVCAVFAAVGAREDDTGLWAAGMLLLMWCAGVGLFLVASVISGIHAYGTQGRSQEGAVHGAKREGPPQPVE